MPTRKPITYLPGPPGKAKFRIVAGAKPKNAAVMALSLLSLADLTTAVSEIDLTAGTDFPLACPILPTQKYHVSRRPQVLNE
jgi:hypothetical protein